MNKDFDYPSPPVLSHWNPVQPHFWDQFQGSDSLKLGSPQIPAIKTIEVQELYYSDAIVDSMRLLWHKIAERKRGVHGVEFPVLLLCIVESKGICFVWTGMIYSRGIVCSVVILWYRGAATWVRPALPSHPLHQRFTGKWQEKQTNRKLVLHEKEDAVEGDANFQIVTPSLKRCVTN